MTGIDRLPGKLGTTLVCPFPPIQKQLVEDLLVEALGESLELLGLFLGDAHLRLGPLQPLLGNLLLLNGGAVLLGNLQAGQVQTLHVHIAKAAQLRIHLLLHLLGDAAPTGRQW